MIEPEIAMEKDRHSISAWRTKRQLLVVDDDNAIQTLLSRTLSSMGYDVNFASNGLEALTLFQANRYDLVITDFQMPLMDGWQLSRLVKEQSPTTPVIVITGCCDGRHLEKLILNGVDAIIPKPFKLREIEQTVYRLLNI